MATNRVRAGQVYIFRPVGMDCYDPKNQACEGQAVRVVNLRGCPKANTMGHAHIQSLGGTFLGLVLTNSLMKAS